LCLIRCPLFTFLAGFTVVEDADGDYAYATLDPEGNLAPSDKKVGLDKIPPGLEKKLKPTKPKNCDQDLCNENEELESSITAECKGNNPAKACFILRRKLREEREAKLAEHEGRRLADKVGTLKNLVVPIRFSDHGSRSLPSQSDLNELFNQKDCSSSICPSGSVHDFYYVASHGQLSLDSYIAPWVTVSMSEVTAANGNSG
jgi:hypothetical protein